MLFIPKEYSVTLLNLNGDSVRSGPTGYGEADQLHLGQTSTARRVYAGA